MTDVPVAISRLGEKDNREAQNLRAVKWLLAQPGGTVVVVTPRRAVESASISALIARPEVQHHAWRGHSGGHYSGQRVLQAWPDRKHLNDVWNVDADAIAVIEWNVGETAEWISHVNLVQLLPGETIEPSSSQRPVLEPPPEDVDGILKYVAAMAAGYSSGLKWNEEDKLKADMMNRPAAGCLSLSSSCAPGASSWACAARMSTPSPGTCSAARRAVASTCGRRTSTSTSDDPPAAGSIFQPSGPACGATTRSNWSATPACRCSRAECSCDTDPTGGGGRSRRAARP